MKREIPWRLLALLALVSCLPLLVKGEFHQYLLVLVLIYATLSMVLNLFVGSLGLLSLDHTALLGVGAYATAIATTRYEWPVWIGLLLSVFIATAASLLLGIVTLRHIGAYFILVTVAFLAIISSLASNLWQYTGGTGGIQRIPKPWFLGLEINTPFRYYFLALVVCLLVLWGFHLLFKSAAGRSFQAIRDTPELAASIGMNVGAIRIRAFAIKGVVTGLAGWTYVHFLGTLDPSIFSFSILFNTIFIVFIGGVGTTLGPLVGSFFVVFLPQVLRIDPFYNMAILAVAMLGVILAAPRGICGYASQLTAMLHRHGWRGRLTFVFSEASDKPGTSSRPRKRRERLRGPNEQKRDR